MNSYEKLRNENQERYNRFADTDNNIVCFFSDKQFQEVLEKTGLTEEQFADSYYHLISGAYVRKDKSAELDKIWEENEKAIANAIKNDPDGRHFVKDMFSYEMANHEYSYTRDLSDTLDSLGYTTDEINKNPKLLNGLNAALNDVKLYDEFEDLCCTDISTHLYDNIKNLSDSEKKTFVKEISSFLNYKLPEETKLDYFVFKMFKADLVKHFIDNPDEEIIYKYSFNQSLNKDFKRLNYIIKELDLRDYVIDDHLIQISSNIEKVKEFILGNTEFNQEHNALSDSEDLQDYVEKNFDRVKPVILQNLLNMNDKALSDTLNELLDLTSNDRVRTRNNFFNGSYSDKPYSSAIEFVHDRKEAACICGEDGCELHGEALYNHADDLRFFYCEADNEPGERDHCTYACIKPENIIERVGITKDNIFMLADDNEELVKKLISNPVSRKQSKSLGR